MALKRRNSNDGSIKYVTFTEDKDQRIKRLEALLKELTETLAEVMDYDKAVAAASSYDCYA